MAQPQVSRWVQAGLPVRPDGRINWWQGDAWVETKRKDWVEQRDATALEQTLDKITATPGAGAKVTAAAKGLPVKFAAIAAAIEVAAKPRVTTTAATVESLASRPAPPTKPAALSDDQWRDSARSVLGFLSSDVAEIKAKFRDAGVTGPGLDYKPEEVKGAQRASRAFKQGAFDKWLLQNFKP